MHHTLELSTINNEAMLESRGVDEMKISGFGSSPTAKRLDEVPPLTMPKLSLLPDIHTHIHPHQLLHPLPKALRFTVQNPPFPTAGQPCNLPPLQNAPACNAPINLQCHLLSPPQFPTRSSASPPPNSPSSANTNKLRSLGPLALPPTTRKAPPARGGGDMRGAP